MNNADKKAKTKKRLKQLLSLCAVIVIVSLSLFVWFRMIGMEGSPVRQYNVGETKRISAEKPDTIDVLFLGSSHCWNSYNPQVLWDEYGYTSYNMGQSAQTSIASYYLLQDALLFQKNIKYVVMDVYYVYCYDQYVNDVSQETNIYLCFSSNYWRKQYIDDVYDRQDWMQQYSKEDLYYATYWNHNSWKALYQDNFDCIDDRYFVQRKGFCYNLNALYNKSFSIPDCSQFATDERQPLDDVYFEYMQKIVELCKSKNIQLIATEAPYLNKTESRHARLNTLTDYLQQEDIPFVSSNTQERYEQLDLNNFFLNIDHLNALGAENETLFIGKYLHDNFDLTDRRGDKKYADFADDFELLRRNTQNNQVNLKSAINDIINQANEFGGYIVIVVGNGNYPVWYTSRTYLAEIGITVPPKDDKRPFYGVYTQEQGLLCNQTFTDAPTNYRKEILGDRVCIDMMDKSFEVRVNDYVIKTETDKAVMIVYDTINDIPARIRYLY